MAKVSMFVKIVAIGLALFVAGCATSAPKEAADAPAWGSSKKFSTVSGFLVGSWRQKVDIGDAKEWRSTKAILETVPTTIQFSAGGKMALNYNDYVVHGTWKATAQGIGITALDVDGIPVKSIDSLGDSPSELSRSSRMASRWFALRQAQRAHLLTLDPDGKRLDQSSEVADPDRGSSMPKIVYVRLGKE